MKTLVIILFAMIATTHSFGQGKKISHKRTLGDAAAAAAKKEISNLKNETAGRYAKDFANKMYDAINFQEKKGSFSMTINKWKPYKLANADGTTKELYFVDLTIRWRSAGTGWPTTWTDVEYNGVLMFDEYGCEPFYMIKTKQEPSSKGLAALVIKRSPVEECNESMKQQVAQMDEWMEGISYLWAPNGCLE